MTESGKEENEGHSSLVRRREDTYVFVLCKCGKPLMPTTAPKARILLRQRKATVYLLHPFTIKLTYETDHNNQLVEIRIDYGAKVHGIALVQQCKTHDRAIFLGEAKQRQDVKRRMDMRRELRDRRRERKTRYRKPRFNNRRRREGWLPPTMTQRVESVTRITRSLMKLVPIEDAVTEIGMFDTQRIANPETESNDYQRGPGYGFNNRRQATLAYFKYTCQYCGTSKGVMTADHVIPKAEGGTDAWNNLTCACKSCNDRKGDRTPKEALMPNPRTVSLGTEFLKFCALTQSVKTKLVEEQQKLLPTKTVYGWQTKENREMARLPKAHYYDALCTETVTKKPLRLTDTIYQINLRKRNTRRVHVPSPKKRGKRGPYNQNRSLNGYRKGDLIRTPYGLAYITGIGTRKRLSYRTFFGRKSDIDPLKVRLVERAEGTQYFPLHKTEKSKTLSICKSDDNVRLLKTRSGFETRVSDVQ